MTELLVVPLKKPTDVEVIKPLKNLIHSAYSGNDANAVDHSEAISEFSKLRNTAIWKAFEKYESSLEVLYGYVISLIEPYFSSLFLVGSAYVRMLACLFSKFFTFDFRCDFLFSVSSFVILLMIARFRYVK